MKYRYECPYCPRHKSEFRLVKDRDKGVLCDFCGWHMKRVLFPKPSPSRGRGVFPGSKEITTPGAAPEGKKTYADSRAVDAMLERTGNEWIPRRNLGPQGEELSNPVG